MDMAIHTYEDIMRLTEDLSEKYIIGYGASSTVYKCVLKSGKAIAVKRLYSQYNHSLREFETELETIGSIRHRNLVSLNGFSLSTWKLALLRLHGKWFPVGSSSRLGS
jgi:LRR receptor-like serine/threonine-protein kinase ERECTA